MNTTTLIKVDNTFLTIEIHRNGFIMAKVHFMSENHGELCECLTIGEGCKLGAEIAANTNSQINPETAFSQIKDLINVGEKNKEIYL